MLTRDVAKGLFHCALFFGALGLVAFTLESCEKKQESRYEQKASESKGRADEHAKAAVQAETVADEARQRAANAEAEARRIRAALAKRKVGGPALPGVMAPVVPADAAGGLPLDLVDLSPLVAAQDKQIAALKDENAALRVALKESKAAFDAERDRANNLWLALEAQKAINKGSLWRGRIEGLAVGFAAGYVGGRLK